jgi:3-oxoacyl-[acyl-carrier protein] reductase
VSEFQGKSVLVTGGTRGIGRAIAGVFAAEGANVSLCGRDPERAAAAAQALASETGGTVHGFGADVAKQGDVDTLIAAAADACGAIQILVNNAGITQDGLLMRMKNEQWDQVLQTNLTGAFYTCRAVARDMIKQRWGRIVNLSSIVGMRGQGGQTNYAAAKAGIIGFTKALAQELASRNVTANVVAPGYIDTDMTADFNDAAREKLLQTIPAGRVGTSGDVAAAVRYLASDDAGYVTGHVLCVDGGLGM